MTYRLPLTLTQAAWLTETPAGTWHIKKIKDVCAELHTELDLDHPPFATHAEAYAYAQAQGLNIRPHIIIQEMIATYRQAILLLEHQITQLAHTPGTDPAHLAQLRLTLALAYNTPADTPTHSLTLHYAGGAHIHTEKRTLTSCLDTIAANLNGKAIAAVITREEYATTLFLDLTPTTPAPTAKKPPTWPRPTHTPSPEIARQN